MAYVAALQMEPGLCWLPADSIIHDRQEEYYAAINASNDAGESTVFIEFMLSSIKASLIDAISTSDELSDEPMDKATMRWKQLEKFTGNTSVYHECRCTGAMRCFGGYS